MTIPQQENPPEQVSTGEQDTSSIFSDFDLYLFGQGKHRRIYEKMGAHHCTVDGVAGGNFALSAPNARAVSVIGDFYGWQHGAPPMHLLHIYPGVWGRLFPGLNVGALFKDA